MSRYGGLAFIFMSRRTSGSVPLSLGKPSLRRRLEAYYILVAPDQLGDEEDWKSRFDKIWEKFGGTVKGEQRLATKLEKKYGSVRTLQIVVDASRQSTRQRAENVLENWKQVASKPEAYYEPTETQRRSGIVSFSHADFDPLAALSCAEENVQAENAWIRECSLLDRVDQCRSILPIDDPHYRTVTKNAGKRLLADANDMQGAAKKSKAPPSFLAIASLHEKGPMSILYDAMVRRRRVRVLIRYVNGIRGTLSGHLLAFDKHFNLLLKDVEEIYSPRCTEEEGRSNTEIELNRRLRGYENRGGETWGCRQRCMKQIMVRGDNIVIVYKPEAEQSAWPATRKSPKETLYRKQSAKRNVPDIERVGTPGSLILASRRNQTRTDSKSAFNGSR